MYKKDEREGRSTTLVTSEDDSKVALLTNGTKHKGI